MSSQHTSDGHAHPREHHHHPGEARHHGPARDAETTTTLATDPVCGMKVDRDKALSVEVGGRTYFFCSQHCRHTFESTHAEPV